MSSDFLADTLYRHPCPTYRRGPDLAASNFMPSREFAGSEKSRYNCESKF